MRFKFLTAAYDEADNKEGRFAAIGEPVIPWFPMPPNHMFVSVQTEAKLSPFAKVAYVDGDPDAYVSNLSSFYPGLPKHLHASYVWNVIKKVDSLKEGILVRVSVDMQTERAVLFEVGATASTAVTPAPYVLWETRPNLP